MRRRKRLSPNPNALDWRDPQMPLVRDYTFRSGAKLTEVTPEFEQEWRQICMERNAAPEWRDDPLYNARRPSRVRK